MKEKNRGLKEEKREVEKKLNCWKERHARLWNKYRKVASSNKPSSKKTRYEKEEEKRRKKERKKRRKGDEDTGGEEEDEGKGKPGRKPGHKPAWREKLEPEEEIDVTQDRCNECGNPLGDPIGQHCRVIEDIPDLQPPTSKQFNIFEYYCETCDKKVVATDPDCPETGDFGPNTLVQTTLFKFEYRLPYRKVSELFDTLYGFSISKASVLAAAGRVANRLDPYYEEVKMVLRNAEAVHVDETSFSVGGKGWWLWSFSNGKYVLYRLVNSRSSGVLEEVLGEDFDGWIICDGLSAYPAFTEKLQRCWSHLFRKVEDVPDEYGEITPIDKKLHEIYHHLNEFLEGDPPPPEREEKKEWAMNAMKDLTEKEYEEEKVEDLITYIENGMEYWFTYVIEPDVEPTNNQAERDLREPIVIRKIIGTLRNEKGTKIFERIMTMLATWKRQELNVKDEMLKAVRT
ncbi:hypothetical protein AKJ42_03250 [candidate division MSBL1 archaeon SCGC-AAA261C02]|uniref:Transposase IS66 central domain-containing protein n=2 Tax=candidate division MSBL1 TaxID=215777 RepID=A0A133UZ06_9EURY|nr:hypothetical protein AKJ42_03250 [candidate division MSBL1 archaeon SCGC-AAA261C02]KXB09513.1 hypothetical protein AKJ46_00230 [candidate division MSBL1 archaeon SCGC-AAA833K04]